MSIAFEPYAPPASSVATQPTFSPGRLHAARAIAEARQSIRGRTWKLLGTFVLYQVLAYGLAFLLGTALGDGFIAQVVAQVLGGIISTFFAIGMTRVYLDVARGQPPRVRRLFSGVDALFATCVSMILSTLVILAGLLCFVIPGIILSLSLSFAPILIADKGLGPMEALSASHLLTKSHRWQVFLLAIFGMIALMLGVLALGVGVLYAFPLMQLAWAHAYLQLTRESSFAASTER